jgi:putative FmdB family regulatory protein
MPTYLNRCYQTGCGFEFENIASIKSDPIKDCPHCGYNEVRRVPQQISFVSVKNGSTLGALAEKNAKKMGGLKDEKLQKMANDRKAKFKGKLPEGSYVKDYQAGTPPWRNPGEPIDLNLTKMTPEETVKYCMENKKPIGLNERKV